MRSFSEQLSVLACADVYCVSAQLPALSCRDLQKQHCTENQLNANLIETTSTADDATYCLPVSIKNITFIHYKLVSLFKWVSSFDKQKNRMKIN